MRVGLVVDATCDLPKSVLQRYNVHIVPTQITLKNKQVADTRDNDIAVEFYKSHSEDDLNAATAISATAESLENALTSDLLYQYDHLLIVVPHLKLSSTLPNLREGLFTLQPKLSELRMAASIKTPFKVRILESNTAYAGYGLVLYEALRLLNEKARTVDQTKGPLDKFKTSLNTFVLPGHDNSTHPRLSDMPFQLSWFTVQKHKLQKTLPFFQLDQSGLSDVMKLDMKSATNDFFEYIYDELTHTQLKNHLVNVSYAGNLSQLRVMPIFKALNEHVASKGGKLAHSLMSPTNAVQLGKGAISVSFAGERL